MSEDNKQQYPVEALNKFRQWHFWWLVIFSFFLIVIFTWYVSTIRLIQASNNEFPSVPGQVSGTGTFFEITDSGYLNVKLESTVSIEATMSSVPKVVSI